MLPQAVIEIFSSLWIASNLYCVGFFIVRFGCGVYAGFNLLNRDFTFSNFFEDALFDSDLIKVEVGHPLPALSDIFFALLFTGTVIRRCNQLTEIPRAGSGIIELFKSQQP